MEERIAATTVSAAAASLTDSTASAEKDRVIAELRESLNRAKLEHTAQLARLRDELSAEKNRLIDEHQRLRDELSAEMNRMADEPSDPHLLLTFSKKYRTVDGEIKKIVRVRIMFLFSLFLQLYMLER